MEQVEHEDEVLEEEERIYQPIVVGYGRRNSGESEKGNYKYATAAEIRSFERTSEILNQQLVQQRPLLFG
jgi:hypothetical protein